MPIPAVRVIRPVQVRNFGRFGDAVEVPALTDVQTKSYDRFLQLDVPAEKRTPTGLEGVLREIFPIESYDKTINLDYIRYELGKPRYGPDECRQLRLTYGRPFKVLLRLNKQPEPVEEEVYLGDMPIMIGGGEFIINGAERVVVSQLAWITWWRRNRATANCTVAASSPNAAAGLRSTSRKKTPWACASTSRASSPP
jgi:DNA-directed RNA polymerase subunit beta